MDTSYHIGIIGFLIQTLQPGLNDRLLFKRNHCESILEQYFPRIRV